MAKAQRRRKKHRGTQAGVVRSRSRGSSRGGGQTSAVQRREERLNRPPSWRSAMNRAGVAASVFLAALYLILKQPFGSSLAIAAFMFVVYIPMGYAMDSFIWRLRQRRKQREKAASDGG